MSQGRPRGCGDEGAGHGVGARSPQSSQEIGEGFGRNPRRDSWKISTRFLEHAEDILDTVIDKPARGGALLHLLLPGKKEPVEDAKVKGSLGCSEHEMVV